jgi:hypothetical protein
MTDTLRREDVLPILAHLLEVHEDRAPDLARQIAAAMLAALPVVEQPCPHVRTSKDGTSYCELAQRVPQPVVEQEPVWINEREKLERKAEGYRDRALHLEHLEAVALRYHDLWLICHENNPRPPEEGELIRLGHLRGLLFAATARGEPQPTTSAEREECAKELETWWLRLWTSPENEARIRTLLLRAARLLRAQPDDEESAVIAAAKVIAASPLIDAPKLGEESWRGLARSILRAAKPQPDDEAVRLLRELAAIPAVHHALGMAHTDNCTCAWCRVRAYLSRKEPKG